MEQIAQALQLNNTYFTQLIIIVVFFVVARFLFFNKLKLVIERRFENTVDLDSKADQTFDKATRLAQDYKQKIDEVYVSAQKKIQSHKQKIVTENSKKVELAEKEADQYLKTKRRELEAEINEKKGAILQETDSLSTELVSKVVN